MRESEVGIVKSANNYLLELEGLPHAKVNSILKNEHGQRAVVSELKDRSVIARMLDSASPQPGEVFFLDPTGITLPPAEKLLKRVVNPLGKPLDRTAADIETALPARSLVPVVPVHPRTAADVARPFSGKNLPELRQAHTAKPRANKLQLGVVARGIKHRETVKNQLKTGLTVVDTLVPIGQGQKEAIFGEPRSGKTSFILDVIINQKGRDVICIYASIGRPEMDVKRFAQTLKKSGADEYTIIISASPREPVPLIALTPEIAFAIAEEFEQAGKDVLLVLDDLGTHAKVLREIALLSGRVPGREAYPGDIFYEHAHLIERAGSFNRTAADIERSLDAQANDAAVAAEKNDGGSITLLPVMETDFESMSQLLPTNLIASTDGHLYFSASLYAQGQYPAISVEQSVTRVGKQTQSTLQKSLSERLRNLLADYEELKKFSLFGAELTPQSRQRIKKGEMAQKMLAQEPRQNIPVSTQVLFLSLLFTSFFDQKDLSFLTKNRAKILETLAKAAEFRALTVKAQDLELDEVITILNSNLGVLEKACRE